MLLNLFKCPFSSKKACLLADSRDSHPCGGETDNIGFSLDGYCVVILPFE
jgi:hypothetical protein